MRSVETLGSAVQSLSQGIAYLERVLRLYRQVQEGQPLQPSDAEQTTIAYVS